jgi:hypothetical protein
MMEDQNWSSQRAQDFQRDVKAGRLQDGPTDEHWGFLSDSEDDDDPGDHGAEGCEMPGVSISGSEYNDFAPYASKTVSSFLFKGQENR